MAGIYEVITAARLQETGLLGVTLTTDNGDAFPDSVYEAAIRQAVATLESDLGIVIDRFDVENEKHDLQWEDRSAFWPFRLDYRPLREVTGIRMRYGSFPAADLPVSWVQHVQHLHAQIHIIPSAQALGSYIVGAGVPLVSLQQNHYVPGYFEIDYSAGFRVDSGTLSIPEGETSGSVTFSAPFPGPYHLTAALAEGDTSGAAGVSVVRRSGGFAVTLATAPDDGPASIEWTADGIPDDLKQAITLLASQPILAIAGDLIVGAGLTSVSTSMDGLSQNIQTTNNANSGGYGARIAEGRRQLDVLMPALRAAYRIPKIACL